MGAIEKQRIQLTISWQAEKKNLELFFLIIKSCGCPVSPLIYEKADSLLLLSSDDSVPACQFGGKDEQSQMKTAIVWIHFLLHGLQCASELGPHPVLHPHDQEECVVTLSLPLLLQLSGWWAPHSSLSLRLSWPRQKVSSAEDGKIIN